MPWPPRAGGAAMRIRAVVVSLAALSACLLLAARPLPGADCNGNGIDDATDLAPTHLRFGPMVRSPATNPRRESLGQIVTGDFDGDGRIDVAAGVDGNGGFRQPHPGP